MAASVNKVLLIGNLGQDPDIKTFPNGGRIANLSLATSESWKDKTTGEKKERVQWHRIVVASDALVDICAKYLKKGSKIFLEGQLETRKYEKDGEDRYVTEVVLRPYRGELTMLDSKGNGGPAAAQAADTYSDSGRAQQPSPQQYEAAVKQPPPSMPDDEIPF